MNIAIARREIPIGAAGSVFATGERVERVGGIVMRGALALIFLWFGAMKFSSYEATGIAPFIANSPGIGWLHSLLGIQGAASLLGVFEVTTGALLLAGFVKPFLSIIGSGMALLTFLITLSLLFTTPGVGEPLAGGFPALSAAPGQFLLKDAGLFAIALFFLGLSLWQALTERMSQSASLHAALRSANQPHTMVVRLGIGALRYSLALIFIWFGAMKFTTYEATAIAPLIANSPLVGWWHGLLGIQGASYLLGVYEIATGILLAMYRIAPRASAVGAAMAVLTFLITISFLFSTPGVAAPGGFPVLSASPGQFLLKDVGLLGMAVWLLGESLLAANDSRRARGERFPQASFHSTATSQL